MTKGHLGITGIGLDVRQRPDDHAVVVADRHCLRSRLPALGVELTQSSIIASAGIFELPTMIPIRKGCKLVHVHVTE